MTKVRKSTKNDFKWRVNISRSTAVKASKFCMILKLDLNNSFPKFGLLTIAQSTNCRLLKKSLNGYISKNWEATWLELTPLSLWCPCFLGTEFHVCSYYGYEYTMITMKSKKKKKIHIFQTTKAKTSKLWLQITRGLDISGSKLGVLEMPTLTLMEKRKKTWINLKVWKITVQNQIWSKESTKVF